MASFKTGFFLLMGTATAVMQGDVVHINKAPDKAPPKEVLKPKPRIIGGEPAEFGRYPYLVDLDTDSGFHLCGGSLIAPNIVLTAAHCRRDDLVSHVKVGRYNKFDQTEDFDFIRISQQISHPLYKGLSSTDGFDFLILVLEQPSDNPYIRINRDPLVPAGNEELTIIGFGDQDPDEALTSFPNILHEVTVNAVTNEVCEQSKLDLLQRYRGFIQDVHMCAADEGEDSCQGDSGGPLILRGDSPGQDFVLGVVSWGFGCANPNFPGVYARVSHEVDWITAIVCQSPWAPPEFDCDNFSPGPPPVPTPPPTPANPIAMTVSIDLDRFSLETGWILEHIVGVRPELLERNLFGTYPAGSPDIERTIMLEEGGLYQFVILDAGGDGIGDGVNDNGGVRLSLDNVPFFSFAGSEIGSGIRFFFYATLGDVENPYFEDKEFAGPEFLTFEIALDDFPYEIGFQLVSVSDGSVIFLRPPGFYQGSRTVVTEVIPIPQQRQAYKLTISDSNGDGLDATAGYALFRGFASDANLIVSSLFPDGFEEELTFITGSQGTLPPSAGVWWRSMSILSATMISALVFVLG